MKNTGSLKLRMIADLILLEVWTFTFVYVGSSKRVTIFRIRGSWGVFLMMAAALLVSGGLMYDLLRSAKRLQKSGPGHPKAQL